MQPVRSSRDALLFALDCAQRSIFETIADLSEEEYNWEPIRLPDRPADLLLPPEKKRVWRVFAGQEGWTYDYTTQPLQPPPFTTIAWILNHAAQTADMYLYCVQTGEAEGVRRRWDDLPVPASLPEMKDYLAAVLARACDFLVCIPEGQVDLRLNELTPAPWGEMRPTCLNLWGGVIEHVIQHAMQIAARKDHIRYGW